MTRRKWNRIRRQNPTVGGLSYDYMIRYAPREFRISSRAQVEAAIAVLVLVYGRHCWDSRIFMGILKDVLSEQPVNKKLLTVSRVGV
jgi:hypothetical protein